MGFAVTVLQLYPPTVTIEYPASLANKSNGKSRNNCRIKHRSGSDYFSIETVTALRAGDEVTVAYGSKFTKHIRSEATFKTLTSSSLVMVWVLLQFRYRVF